MALAMALGTMAIATDLVTGLAMVAMAMVLAMALVVMAIDAFLALKSGRAAVPGSETQMNISTVRLADEEMHFLSSIGRPAVANAIRSAETRLYSKYQQQNLTGATRMSTAREAFWIETGRYPEEL